MEAATPCKHNITRGDEMPLIPNPPRRAPSPAAPTPPTFRNLGQFDATSGSKLTKVHSPIGWASGPWSV